MKFLSIFNSSVKPILLIWGKEAQVDNSKAQRILGVRFRPAKESFFEMAESMIAAGVIKDKRKKA